MKEVVYRKKNYVLIKKPNYYMVVNVNKEFEKGHTHVQSKEVGIVMIKNIVNGIIPKSNNIYLLESYLRVSSDRVYKQKIQRKIDCINLGLEV